MKEFKGSEWSYRAVFTQTVSGTVLVTFTFHERTIILFGSLGPDDYAANRTAVAELFDAASQRIGTTMTTTSLDDELVPLISEERTEVEDKSGVDFDNTIVVGAGDKWTIKLSALALNETVTLAVRMLIRSWPPTVSTAGSVGTVTTAETYNKVI